jgi:hypothetical protein
VSSATATPFLGASGGHPSLSVQRGYHARSRRAIIRTNPLVNVVEKTMSYSNPAGLRERLSAMVDLHEP